MSWKGIEPLLIKRSTTLQIVPITILAPALFISSSQQRTADITRREFYLLFEVGK